MHTSWVLSSTGGGIVLVGRGNCPGGKGPFTYSHSSVKVQNKPMLSYQLLGHTIF